jgi:3'-phosphoadenosine 5'-phosphosulfate (PAPS) 3'-phosphatase
MMLDFTEELAAAREVAQLASELLRREYENFTAIPDAPVTISTHADKASQQLILDFLHKRFPNDALCAEESTPDFDSLPKTGTRAWVVDPIDGTRGFARKVGQFSAMIGFLWNGEPVAGVVAEPAQNRYTFARKNGGCWWHVGNNTPTQCRVSSRGFAELVLVQSWAKTGMSSKPVAALTPARVIETYSGGVKLAAVARGEADVYANTYEAFADWDICAGHILVTEAGGVVTDLAGNPITYQGANSKQLRGLVATNGIIHTEAVTRLAKHSA